jgi:hypothetical protein
MRKNVKPVVTGLQQDILTLEILVRCEFSAAQKYGADVFVSPDGFVPWPQKFRSAS